MTIPQNPTRAQRDHPLVYCEECGRRLGTGWGFNRAPCPSCGGLTRRYQLTPQVSVTTNPQLRTVRTFYQRHPGWLAVQLAIIAACGAIGVVGLIFGVLASIIGLVAGAVLGVVALVLPGWKDHVEERRLTAG